MVITYFIILHLTFAQQTTAGLENLIELVIEPFMWILIVYVCVEVSFRIFVFRRKRKVEESRSIRFSIYMTIAFTYIIYPLIVATYSKAVAYYLYKKTPSISKSLLVFGALALVLSLVLTYHGIRLYKISIPTKPPQH